ncbi:DUF2844 domain-containing protein [Burkholderia ubonensis]
MLGEMIVYVSGHMGNFSVKAWLPNALPTGMQNGTIR